ncbi:MAG: hypothetical protein EPN72_03965 [Nevskiaceae bacterium]|nr:MAG: hypothetical protein EPN63_06745 [Nevskiaceae bacterium]TBR73976.1 MAG: hypothetical protein EPN72_03965 [Nevskiaceae bacterium]
MMKQVHRYRHFRGLLRAALCSLPLLALTGCMTIYRPTGVVLTHYAQDEVVPYALGSTDFTLATCGSGMGLQQLLGSFSRVIKRSHVNMMDVELLSAFCSEQKANEANLKYLQAVFMGNAPMAQDAHIAEQRWQKVTAQRRFEAYKDFVAAYGPIGVTGDKCPGFEDDMDAAQYLAGLITSVQALLSDIQAGSVVGVPQDVAAKVGKSSTCLSNEKWWGVPQAIRGVVWATVPGTTPQGQDPWVAMHRAIQVGRKAGMPLAATLQGIAAFGVGDYEKEKQSLRDVKSIMDLKKMPKDFAMLGTIGEYEALVLSDRIWMKAKGHRTPYQGFGTFPDDVPKNATPPADLENLLD